jgi:two-component system, NarL family, response regulator NreC
LPAGVRVLIIDDGDAVRAGLTKLVDAEEDMEIVEEAGNAPGAAREARNAKPTVVVIDATMYEQGGTDDFQRILRDHPGAQVVVLSTQGEPQNVNRAFERGASGYVLKQAVDRELVPAIREVAAGGRYVDPELGAQLIAAETAERRRAEEDPLTDREREVLRLLALGHTNQEIAEKLYISVRTVESHRAHILQKLALSSRADLVKYALDEGLLT